MYLHGMSEVTSKKGILSSQWADLDGSKLDTDVSGTIVNDMMSAGLYAALVLNERTCGRALLVYLHGMSEVTFQKGVLSSQWADLDGAKLATDVSGTNVNDLMSVGL